MMLTLAIDDLIVFAARTAGGRTPRARGDVAVSGHEASKKKRVLVIDDEEPIVLLLSTILGVFGYECLPASSATHGLEIARRELPATILLDIAMADVDGYEVCRRLKADPVTSSIPVIMISALALDQDRKQAMASGASGFILKPFDPKDVIAEIERWTSGNPAP